MNKIAIISDIHGNKAALEAVLKDIKDRKVDKIFCLGDCVTKCSNPDVVIDLVRKNCDVVLKGNCDDVICSDRSFEKKFWTRMKIGEERADYLKNLPVMYEFYLSGQLVRLFHSSPFSLHHIFNPVYSNKHTKYSELEILNIAEMFENTEFIGKNKDDKVPDIVGYGHLHTPNLFKYKNKTVFNTGSVGIPNEMENDGKEDYTNSFSTLASYIILEGNLDSKEVGSISFSNIRVAYDISKEISDLENSDMPGKEKAIFCLKTAYNKYDKE